MKLIYIKQDNDIHIIIYKEACAEAPRKKRLRHCRNPIFLPMNGIVCH